MNTTLRTVVALALLIIGASTAWAEDTGLQAIRATGVIRIGTTGDYKPFSYRSADGELVGADIEMAKDLAASLGVRVEFVTTTWTSLLDDFAHGKFDVALGGLTVNPARSAAGDFSIPNVSDGKRPIVRCADKDRYRSIEAIDQASVHVVVNPGGTNDRFAKDHFSKAQIEVYPDNATIFDEIASGKADVMVSDGIEVDLQSKLHPGILCPANVSAPFTQFEDAYLLRKDPALKAAVDGWMRRELDDGGWSRHLAAAMH